MHTRTSEISEADNVGYIARNCAAAPETCGHAIDVPDQVAVASSEAANAAVMPAPGAKTANRETRRMVHKRRGQSGVSLRAARLRTVEAFAIVGEIGTVVVLIRSADRDRLGRGRRRCTASVFILVACDAHCGGQQRKPVPASSKPRLTFPNHLTHQTAWLRGKPGGKWAWPRPWKNAATTANPSHMCL